MAVYAYCFECKRHHRRGTKIFSEHKAHLGMYKDTATGSRIPGMKLPVNPWKLTQKRLRLQVEEEEGTTTTRLKYFGAHGYTRAPQRFGLFIVETRKGLEDARAKLFSVRLHGFVSERPQKIEGEWAETLKPLIAHIKCMETIFYTYLGNGVYFFEGE